MADVTAVLGLVGGLGTAVIGAVGGSLLQRSKNRQDRAAIAVQRADDGDERRRLANELMLEIITSARTANRALLASLERFVQDAEAGRSVDADRFDEQVGTLEADLVGALHRLAASETAIVPTESLTGEDRPFAEVVADMTASTRKRLLEVASGSSMDRLETDFRRARATSADLDVFLRAQTEVVVGRPLGFRLAIDEV
ncbi:hypothetical protein [Streptomyces sp. NRRL B-24572]|uniref:hypothetical protein n=1 Tax=Streptomyces sp. NRRL B-24572 TaxID=1962156 RepID=UPI00117CDAEB|nr:hypothetical protein [Streptomyces sp. NRRL B-24572]